MAKPPRTERLLALLLLLLNRQSPLTRSDIRAMVKDYPAEASDEAFAKMFERDKDELRSLGFPIETIESDDPEGVAYVLENSDVLLDSIEFTAGEKAALSLAARYWAGSVNQSNATHALKKLESVSDSPESSQSSIPLTYVSQDAKVDLELIRVVDTAATNNNAVSIEYKKPGELDSSARLVSPWGIVLHSGTSYLVGYDHDRRDVRSFKLTRISDLPKAVKGTDYVGAGDQDPKDVLAAAISELKQSKDPTAQVSKAIMSSGDGSRYAWEGDDDLAGEVGRVLTSSVAGQKDAQARFISGEFAEPLEQLAKARKAARRQPAQDSTTQFTRILAIVPWLVNNQGVPTSVAAREFGISEEQLVKDLNLAYCTEFGFDNITMDFYIHSTLQVLDPQGIDRPLKFSVSEAFALQLGLLQLQQLPGIVDLDAIVSAGQKLAVATGVEPGAVQVSAVVSDTTAAYLGEIESAIERSEVLQLTYLGSLDTDPTVRQVEPQSVTTVDSQSYLVAWCRQAEGVRFFRFDRIQNLTSTGETFQPGQHASQSAESRPLADATEFAVIRVDSSLAWWVDTLLDAVQVIASDGSLLVSIPLGSSDWLIKTVAGFAGEVQILEPASLVDNFEGYLVRANPA
ncbi:MAG: WYL domain-containing protein [Candidatus Nanopelagicales bacterium]